MVDHYIRHMEVASDLDKSKISGVNELKSGVGYREIGVLGRNTINSFCMVLLVRRLEKSDVKWRDNVAQS